MLAILCNNWSFFLMVVDARPEVSYSGPWYLDIRTEHFIGPNKMRQRQIRDLFKIETYLTTMSPENAMQYYFRHLLWSPRANQKKVMTLIDNTNRFFVSDRNRRLILTFLIQLSGGLCISIQLEVLFAFVNIIRSLLKVKIVTTCKTNI